MFEVSLSDADRILKDYGIKRRTVRLTELERLCYEKNDPASKEVRLIVKAELSDNESVVVRFRNENNVSPKLIEKQCQFAELLKQNGIETPALYKGRNGYANRYSINNYDVTVTVEQFAKGELQCVNTDIAEKTGTLLAKMHNIAETADFHVENSVLFDPFADNDLFAYSEFKKHEKELLNADPCLYEKISDKYEKLMNKLAPIKTERKYAVQGDISNCNMYLNEQGQAGIFDFNNCGDNYLYCDAVMQAVFESRLMDYPESRSKDNEALILSAFLKGYELERPFSEDQKEMYPYLLAIINAFWSADVKWNENSLLKELERKNTDGVRKWLKEIHKRINLRRELYENTDQR